jgi:hypothetical protein
LAAHGIVPRNANIRGIAEKHRVLLLWHERTEMPLDLVLGGAGIEDAFCRRAQIHVLGGAGIPVISAEDLVAAKILTGRAKDTEDVRAILRAGQGALDIDQVTRILRQFEQALDRSDLVSTLQKLTD